MPNWCTGELKVRGKYKDIKNFLINEIKELRGFLNSEVVNPIIEEDELELEIKKSEKGQSQFYLNGSRRGFIYSPIEVYKDNVEDGQSIITTNLGDLECAWGTDTDILIKHSREYNIDFKIYAYERGMEFNIDFEVHKGNVIKNDEIKFNDYDWECTNPSIGG
ncbi:hypothetical protein [Clostridium botulinum]|uniref:hypothetical protein n=1 Tax=Clostridium botulinum TaxID=1491 RepID=UPI0007745AA8|nr:hypothetical protein [Clostridium botulinum]NFA37362.1 hypothetical protein [Clostridium botulinum]